MKLGTHILTGEKATAFQGFMLSGGRGCCKCDRARNHTQVAVKILEKERIVALASVGLSIWQCAVKRVIIDFINLNIP